MSKGKGYHIYECQGHSHQSGRRWYGGYRQDRDKHLLLGLSWQGQAEGMSMQIICMCFILRLIVNVLPQVRFYVLCFTVLVDANFCFRFGSTKVNIVNVF